MFEKTISNEQMIFPCGMSRSGTTLLTTVLDSHSQISLGYELLPAELPPTKEVISNLEEAASEFGGNDLVSIGKILRKKGFNAEGLFAVRVARSGIEYEGYVSLLKDSIDNGYEKIKSVVDRFRISYEVVAWKASKEDAAISGFKMNNASYNLALKLFPNSYYIYILRDPRDVWVSHIKRNFKKTVTDVCDAWITFAENFVKFSEKHPDIARLIRYEDLVTTPVDVINNMFSILPVEVESSVYEFYKSNATVHRAGHPNSEQLSQDFFTSSIGNWKDTIKNEDRLIIEKKCGDIMKKHDYL